MTSILGIISGILACVIGVWRLFTRKAKERRKRIDEAEKIIHEGIDSGDVSRINAGINRLRRK